MSLIEGSIRRPVTVAVAVLLVVIFGVIGLFRVPVQLTPNVDQPVISVTTRWFGASPQEIEQEIVEEQEDILKGVEGLREMRSTSVEGEAKIEMQFLVGVDKEAALNEVRDKLRQVPEYPTEVDEPVVESVDSSSDNYIAWMVVRPLNYDPAATRPAVERAARGDVRPGHDYRGDVTELQTFMEETVKPVLERVPGIAEVNVVGGREREMQVRVDLEKLAVRGIPMDEFTARLRGENLDVTAGTVVEGKRDVSIRALGRYDDAGQILDTVIAHTPTGAPVYARDVAEASVGFKKQVAFVRSRGQDVVAINAKREVGSNILTVMDGLKAAVDRVNEEVLKPKEWGLELFQVYDETIYVDRSVNAATKDLLIGAGLAVVVLFLTLRSVGATLVVALSIPISIIGTFLGMYLAGRNLNVISMAGLAFAIGMGIDNTIVVLENIFRHREMGKDRFAAAYDGTREVWGAIVAATLANIAVFLPVAFIEEEAGQLFRDISIAISISLFLYMVVSPTVIPMLANKFLRKMPAGLKEGGAAGADGDGSRGGGDTKLGHATAPIARLASRTSTGFYNLILWLTGGVMRRLALVVVMIGLAIAASWWLMPPRTYLPSGNQNFVFSVLAPPPGYSVDEFRRMAATVEAQLQPWWEVDPVKEPEKLRQMQQGWRQGVDKFALPAMQQMVDGMRASMPPEQAEAAARPLVQMIDSLKRMEAPAGIDNYFFVAFGGRVFMGATSRDESNVASTAQLLQGSIQGLPGTGGFAAQVPIFRLGRIGGATVDLNVTGNDYDRVRQAAAAIRGGLMGAFRTFVNADPSNFDLGRAETQIVADRPRAAAAGVSTPAIREVAQVAVDGAVIGDFRDRGDVIDLTVMTRDRFDRSSEDLAKVPVATRDGSIMPLGAVARFVDTSAAQQINRLEREPSVTLSVQLPPNMTVDEATTIINDGILGPMRKSGALPQGVRTSLTGSADKLQEFMTRFGGSFVLAAVITFLLLAALFESFLHPFVIIMSVPFALVGGFLGLRVLHELQPEILLDVLTMLGFVILIGTIVNNPILIVHQALNYIREGMGRNRAIALSTQTRVRPIFMSVVVSVAGMAPLVIFGGAGSELYRGLGAVVVGGLLVSTVFTLILTPALMSLMLDAQDAAGRLFRRRPPTTHGDRPARHEVTDAEERERELATLRTRVVPPRA